MTNRNINYALGILFCMTAGSCNFESEEYRQAKQEYAEAKAKYEREKPGIEAENRRLVEQLERGEISASDAENRFNNGNIENAAAVIASQERLIEIESGNAPSRNSADNVAKNRDAQSADSKAALKKLGMIALAMHNYHELHQQSPPAVLVGPDGKTTHSWRVALLPFMGSGSASLYQNYRFDEPWNSEHNSELAKNMPSLFRRPQDKATSIHTGYYVLVGEGGLFSAQPAQRGKHLRDITDGISHTILVIQAKQKTIWTKPEDITFDPTKGISQFGGLQKDGLNVVFADGAPRLLPANLDKEKLNAVYTARGGEEVQIP